MIRGAFLNGKKGFHAFGRISLNRRRVFCLGKGDLCIGRGICDRRKGFKQRKKSKCLWKGFLCLEKGKTRLMEGFYTSEEGFYEEIGAFMHWKESKCIRRWLDEQNEGSY